MKKTSIQTKSFIVLFSVAALGTLAALLVAGSMKSQDNQVLVAGPEYQAISHNQTGSPTMAQEPVEEPEAAVDTSKWTYHSDESLGISFKYNPEWKVKTAVKQGDYNVLQIDPGRKFFNIKIIASEKGYYAMEGLPYKQETVGGLQAKNVNNILYGVQKGPVYYTFDIGYSLSLKPQFKALVDSVQFNK